MALACQLTEQLEVVGVTTVAGNVELPSVVDNTRSVLGLIGRADVPVAAGADTPLLRPLRTAPSIHGPRGLGDVDPALWNAPRARLVPESAAELIAQTARRLPGEVTIVATGPLTNLALALRMDPPLASRLNELVIMGGAIEVPGNAAPLAEANFFTDPEAARIVLSSGIPIVLVPLDATEQVTVSAPELDAWYARTSQASSPLARFAYDILSFYLRAYHTYGRSAGALHDPLAVALVARPDLGQLEPLHVEVATADPLTAGTCVVDRRPATPLRPTPPPNVRACLRVDANEARRFILEQIFPVARS